MPDREQGRIHIVGAGPVGLLLAALLQSTPEQQVRLYERRTTYTRARMVALAGYLVANSIESYRADLIDGQDVAAIFDPEELEARLAYRRTVAPVLRALLDDWTRGFVAINTVENGLSELIEGHATGTVDRVTGAVTAADALGRLGSGDVLVDCSGSQSILRDQLLPGEDLERRGRNTRHYRMEYALVVTFLYNRPYRCDERCVHLKNRANSRYMFVPSFNRTHYDGELSHVSGLVAISRDEFEAMPVTFGGEWLREHFPEIAASIDRFVEQVGEESDGAIVGDLDITRIPLDVYGARNVTSRRWHASGLDHPLASAPVFLAGDAAMGSPYFQSISLGLECAFFLAGHLANRALPMGELFDRYEQFMHLQWLRVFMRTQMIKHNKDLLHVLDDPERLVSLLHIF